MTLREQLHELLEDRYGDKVTVWGSIVTGKKVRVDINDGTVDMLLALFRDAMLSDEAVNAATEALLDLPGAVDPAATPHSIITAALDAVMQSSSTSREDGL